MIKDWLFHDGPSFLLLSPVLVIIFCMFIVGVRGHLYWLIR